MLCATVLRPRWMDRYDREVTDDLWISKRIVGRIPMSVKGNAEPQPSVLPGLTPRDIYLKIHCEI